MGSTNAAIRSSRPRHIVMAPYMAQGHLIPFVALAKHIQKRTGFTITIATTPLNLKYLQKAIISGGGDNTISINLSELPFSSSDHGLPPNTENTEALTLTQIAILGTASMSLKSPFQALVEKITSEEGAPPLCIISDVFLGWASEVAIACNTMNITFTTGGAYGTAAYTTMWRNFPHRKLKPGEEEFSLPGFPETVKIHVSQLHKYIREADGTDEMSRFFQSQLRLSSESAGWLCNTTEEIEKSGLEILRNILQLPVWPIGPLLPEFMLKKTRRPGIASNRSDQRAGKEYGIAPNECMEWLDSKKENSVLFISFGSQNSIKQSQMMALAAGLEQCGTSFIWVVRPPVEFHLNAAFRPEWLPSGFEERVTESKKGLLVRQWAPQLEILAHKSTGAFLSHCGWNSVMEGLSQRVPIIGWPLVAEQAYNSKMLVEEMGVAVEICRGLDGVLTAEAVKSVAEEVMRGERLRRNAEEIGVRIRDGMRDEQGFEGSSIKALDEFVAYVMSKTKTDE
ncbi:unnamed protein product [Rhodiola kirilowii]